MDLFDGTEFVAHGLRALRAAQVCPYIYIYIYVYRDAYLHMRTYIYIYIYIYVCICTHILVSFLFNYVCFFLCVSFVLIICSCRRLLLCCFVSAIVPHSWPQTSDWTAGAKTGLRRCGCFETNTISYYTTGPV